MTDWIDRQALPKVALRFAVAIVLLALVFRLALPAQGEGMLATLASAWTASAPVALFWLAVAFAILGVSFAIGALRFQGLMHSAGLTARFSAVFRAYIVAGFFNLVLPGAILGDVYRFVDARVDAGRGSEVLGVLVLERLLSLSALGSIGLVAAPAIPLADADRSLVWLLVGLCALFAIGTLLALHPVGNRALRRLAAPFARISQRLADAGDGALAALAGFSDRPAAIARAFGLSLLNQGLPVLAIMALAVPLEADIAWYWYAIIVPFVTLVSLVPISIGGTGVRESLYVALFGAVGMPAAAALALSLSVLAAAMVWALVGFVIFLLYRRREPELATPA